METFSLGPLETNAYVVSEEGRPECWIFDCPGSPGELIDRLKRRGASPQGVFLTHAHGDHMAGLTEVRTAFPGIPVFQHVDEVAWLSDPQLNLSAWMDAPVTAAPAEQTLVDGQRLALGSLSCLVLHVPGHSPGSLAFWFERHDELMGGDVLFRGGVGRWDFPGCDRDALRRSLERLCGLPDSVCVRPGHGRSTTLGREKSMNPYLRSDEPWE